MPWPSLLFLVSVLGQQLAAQELGVAGSFSSPSANFEPRFSPVAEDPTASMIFIEPEVSMQCPTQPFQSYVFSETPPVVYVASFVSDEEALHLIQRRLVDSDETRFRPSFSLFVLSFVRLPYR